MNGLPRDASNRVRSKAGGGRRGEAMPPSRKQTPAGATGRPQHDRPNVGATNPDDPRTDFTACWGRLSRQWLLPSDPTATVELTVADLQAALMELFTAGGVHHVAQTRRMFDRLANNPALADLAIEAAYGRPDLPDTELELAGGEDPASGSATDRPHSAD